MRTVGVLRPGIAEPTHIGGRLYVSHAGTVLADVAVGSARAGVDVATDSMMMWLLDDQGRHLGCRRTAAGA